MSVTVNLPGGPREGDEINVEETLDRWSEIKLSDGNKLKIKQTIIKELLTIISQMVMQKMQMVQLCML